MNWRSGRENIPRGAGMNLQINVNGAWRNVADFSDDDIDLVKHATLLLAQALTRPSWRICKPAAGRSPEVIAYLEGPTFRWRKP